MFKDIIFRTHKKLNFGKRKPSVFIIFDEFNMQLAEMYFFKY